VAVSGLNGRSLQTLLKAYRIGSVQEGRTSGNSYAKKNNDLEPCESLRIARLRASRSPDLFVPVHSKSDSVMRAMKLESPR